MSYKSYFNFDWIDVIALFSKTMQELLQLVIAFMRNGIFCVSCNEIQMSSLFRQRATSNTPLNNTQIWYILCYHKQSLNANFLYNLKVCQYYLLNGGWEGKMRFF